MMEPFKVVSASHWCHQSAVSRFLFRCWSEEKLELSSTLALCWVTVLKLGRNNTDDHIDRGNKRLPCLHFCDVPGLKIQPVKAAAQ